MALATTIPATNLDECGWLAKLSESCRDGVVTLIYADSVEEGGNAAMAEAIRGNYPERAGHVEQWGGYKIIRSGCLNPESAAKGHCMAAAHRGDNWKPVFNYRFTSLSQRESFIAAFKIKELETKRRRDERTAAKKEARANFVNPTKKGDLFYTSWGYDQTNIDFFECVKTTAKSVTLRPVCENRTETGYMSGTASPIKGKYCGEAFTVTYQLHADGSGYLPAQHGSYYPHDGSPKSWSAYA